MVKNIKITVYSLNVEEDGLFYTNDKVDGFVIKKYIEVDDDFLDNLSSTSNTTFLEVDKEDFRNVDDSHFVLKERSDYHNEHVEELLESIYYNEGEKDISFLKYEKNAEKLSEEELEAKKAELEDHEYVSLELENSTLPEYVLVADTRYRNAVVESEESFISTHELVLIILS